MSRRIVPWTFLAMLLLGVALPLAARLRASGAPGRVPDVRGAWDGFFQPINDPDAQGLVRSVIYQQSNRRIQGDAVWLDLEGRSLFNAYNFSATVARDDFITGTGRTLDGRLVFQASLETFEGREGDAGVIDSQILLVPVRGRQDRVDSILLRPFPPSLGAPDVAGDGEGTFHSVLDPTFGGRLSLGISPLDRGSFPGSLALLPEVGLGHSFQLLATTSGDRRFLMIAQGASGRIIADGVASPPRDGVASIDAVYRLLGANERHADFGAMNFSIAAPLE